MLSLETLAIKLTLSPLTAAKTKAAAAQFVFQLIGQIAQGFRIDIVEFDRQNFYAVDIDSLIAEFIAGRTGQLGF